MMKKILLILIIFVSSCGYQPIYINKDINTLEFKKITLEGESEINEKIINTLSIKKNDQGENQNELFISSSTKIIETSKDSKGKVKSFKTLISVELEIRNLKKEIVKRKNFVEESIYNNKDNKYELTEYQNSTKNNLVEKIISDINIYLNII